MNQVRTASASTVAASILMGVQGLLSVMMAIALVAVRPHARLPLVENGLRDIRLELGITAALVAFFFIIVAFAVSRLEDWARIAALVAEGAVLFLTLARFPAHPAASFVSAGLAALAFGLLITDNAWNPPSPDSGASEPHKAATAH